MTPKIIVHVGANKTGTSAIQAFLAMNRAKLAGHGVLVPNDRFKTSDIVEGYHVFGFEALLADPASGRPELERAIGDLAGPSVKTILLSAENLAAHPNGPSLFEGLAQTNTLRVVMYIRRQDDYIVSSWRQWNSKMRSDFWEWLVRFAGNIGDWQRYLEAWERVVPRDQITVRLFDRRHLEGGDVVEDFYKQIGVDAPLSEFDRPKATVNPSLSDAVVNLAKGNPLIHSSGHDPGFQEFVTTLTGDRYFSSASRSFLTGEQRRSILQRYEESNKWVQANYFPELSDKPLFTIDRGADVHVSSDEILEEQLQFLTTALYQLYRRMSD